MQQDDCGRIRGSRSHVLAVQQHTVHLHEAAVWISQLLGREHVQQGLWWPCCQRVQQLLEPRDCLLAQLDPSSGSGWFARSCRS